MRSTHAPRRLIAALTIVVQLALIVPAHAHHSFAMFDPQRELTLHGVVKEFRWTNPHAFIQLTVPNGASGAEEEWSIELTSPEHLARAGWKPGTLKGGDE